MEDLRRSRDAVTGDADLIELRLDLVDRPDVAAALHGRRTPVIVTCRAQWEGGGFTGSEDERRRILESAVDRSAPNDRHRSGRRLRAGLRFVRAAGRGHRAVGARRSSDPPTDLESRYAGHAGDRGRSGQARDSCRQPRRDAAAVRPRPRVTRRARPGARADRRWAVRACRSRVLAARLRNRWTYAGDGSRARPDACLAAAARLSDSGAFAPDAALYAVVGNPIIHSLSPVMHNAGFAALGLNAVYVPLEAREPGRLRRGLRSA